MGSYESFASVYDLLMDNVPYDEWCAYLKSLLEREGIRDGLVLELGCGTGQMTERLAAAGYDMIGVDSSADMLEIAQQKKEESGQDILYLLQDMREFELYGTVRAVVSVCDSMNYITSEEDLLQVFRLVNNYLDPGGLFVFDMNTAHTYRDVEGSNVFAENREECSFIWENTWFEEEKINEFDLTLFLRLDNGLYRKQCESHFQRAYEIRRIEELLREAGLIPEAVYEACTQKAPDEQSERVYFIARECGK